MKTATHGKWQAWESNGKVLLSNEDEKKLYSFASWDDLINSLYLVAGDKPAARAINKQVKQA